MACKFALITFATPPAVGSGFALAQPGHPNAETPDHEMIASVAPVEMPQPGVRCVLRTPFPADLHCAVVDEVGLRVVRGLEALFKDKGLDACAQDHMDHASVTMSGFLQRQERDER